MKLSNIFKKGNSTKSKAKVEKLEKSQLSAVIGGAEAETIISPLDPGEAQEGKLKGKIITDRDMGTLS